MLRWIIFAAINFCLLLQFANAQSYGNYIGTVQTEWNSDGRTMKLLADFVYKDPKGLEWRAPEGWIVDGASIPPLAWPFIGGPFEGKYRNASVIHDVGCDQKVRDWEAVHEVFYWAMLASGVETWRAKIMYGAVYHFGPRWPKNIILEDLPLGLPDLAKEKALLGAGPGSVAIVVSSTPKFRMNNGIPFPTGRADYEVAVTPPVNAITEQEFGTLRRKIEEKEPSAAGGFSLEEIRAFKPGR